MHRRNFFAIPIALMLGACATTSPLHRAASAPLGLPPAVVAMLNSAGIPTDAMGVVVVRLSDGATIVSHQPDASLQPGSTMKLVTTIVGLEKLGPTRRWRTELLTVAPVEDGTLMGDLIVRGGGDGDLTWEAFNRMLIALRQKGIRDIRGDLVLDREQFRPARTDIGVPPFDESPEAEYNVIPDALLVNTNLLRIDFEADKQSLRARMTPELENVSLDLQLKLIDVECKKWEDGWIVPDYVKSDDGTIRIRLHGTFPRNCSATTKANVLDRNDFTDRLFRRLWGNLGGTIQGSTREGTAPTGARLLADHRSRTLADMLREINKPSDNALTRVLFLTLGTIAPGTSDTSSDKADRQIRSWFRENGISDDGLVLENGSGLSRKERIRPSQLAAMLRAEYRSNWAPEFLSSLPIVGLDGTMRLRLRDSAAAGRARMKTGTLDNVVALAGYVPDAAGQMHGVVAIINHKMPVGKLWPLGRPIVDAMVDWVAHSGAR